MYANIYLETETEDLNKQRRMETSIRNLLISTITGLTKENIKITIKVTR